MRLRTSAVNDFRKNYRKFRTGKAFGATGEGPKAGGGEEEEEEELEEGEEVVDADTSVFEAENTRLYQRVADYRRRYRSYREGNPKGIRWDASRSITREEAKVTPVAQLAAFLRTQVAPSLGMRRVVSTLNFTHRSTFHAHIGAGKLGLGLVVPAIIESKVPHPPTPLPFSPLPTHPPTHLPTHPPTHLPTHPPIQVPFAVINHPSKAWEPITFSPSRYVFPPTHPPTHPTHSPQHLIPTAFFSSTHPNPTHPPTQKQ